MRKMLETKMSPTQVKADAQQRVADLYEVAYKSETPLLERDDALRILLSEQNFAFVSNERREQLLALRDLLKYDVAMAREEARRSKIIDKFLLARTNMQQTIKYTLSQINTEAEGTDVYGRLEHEMIWGGERTLETLTKLRVAEMVLRWIEPEDTEFAKDHSMEVRMAKATEMAMSEVMRRSARPAMSTSPMSNLYEQMMLAAWTNAYQLLTSLTGGMFL